MKGFIFIVLLVVVIITTGCVQSGSTKSIISPTPTSAECNYRSGYFDSCNGICYDGETQMCCGGTIYNAKESENVCCGGKVYPYQSGWDCCPDTYLNRWIDNSQVWFNTSNQHCCSGKVTNGGGTTGWYGTTKQWQDCGNSCYDTRTQSCCEPWEINGSYTIQEGKAGCCKDISVPLPQDLKCDPTNGRLISKNQTSSGCTSGYGQGSCWEQLRQQPPQENFKMQYH